MCTVTVLTLPDGGYLLATNRDESPRRGRARPPSMDRAGEVRFLSPRDVDAGGTWVAVDERGRTVCLLNGDRARSPPPEPGVPSRGLLVLELIRDAGTSSVRRRLQDGLAARYRPFKLIVVEPGVAPGGHAAAPSMGATAPTPSTCRTLRAEWSGEVLAFEDFDGPNVTVSSTFQREDVARHRTVAFEHLLSSIGAPGALESPGNDLDRWQRELRAFQSSHHGDAPGGDAFSVCMHRDDARTVSATMITVTASFVSVDYQDGWPCEQGTVTTARLARGD